MAKRSGPPYRRIVVTFWNDPDVKRALSLEEKAFLAYLFSNEHSHPCGLYRLPPIHVLDELAIDEARMRELFDGPIAPFATYDWDTEEVLVHNMAEHQIDGGLHGKDNRIRWVVNQLETIHSEGLLRAFHSRYRDWNLPWKQLVGADALPTPENPRGRATEQGASEGPSQAPSPEPETEPGDGEIARSGREPGTEPRSKGLSKGLGKPDPDPDPVPEGVLQPPAESSGETLGQEGVKRRSKQELADRPKHELTDELWNDPAVRTAVVETWHRGEDAIEIHGATVGMKLEYLHASDLLHATDGDVDFVRWLIVDAPRVLEWDDRPRTLAWAKHPRQLGPAEKAYSERNPGATYGAEVKRAPEGKRPDSERHRELRAQLEEARARLEAG